MLKLWSFLDRTTIGITATGISWYLVGVSCGGPHWTPADTTAATHAVELSQRCGALCAGEGGCPPEVAAGCFEAVDCNVGSMLRRHGAPDHDAGAECKP